MTSTKICEENEPPKIEDRDTNVDMSIFDTVEKPEKDLKDEFAQKVKEMEDAAIKTKSVTEQKAEAVQKKHKEKVS